MSERTGLDAQVGLDRNDFQLDVALTVDPGQIVAVLGPNGAGKSTLLRMLAGLTRPTRGHITVDGQVWDDAHAARHLPVTERAAAIVFQDYRLFPHLSVLDNVAFSARSRGIRRGAAREAAGAVLDRLELNELSDRRPGVLSGGQAQRVALARALASEPRLLLLDEPLAALDARTRLTTRTQLRHYLRQFDGPTVLVTHDPIEAMVLADRLVVLEGGRVAQSGTPSQVARRPATDYVARLVGLNLYAGVVGDAARGRVELDGGGALVAAGRQDLDDASPPLVSGAPVLVAVPPSAISLFTHEPDAGSARNVWTGVVSGLELLTDRVRVSVDGAPEAIVDITPAALADLGLMAGQRVWLSAKATEVVAYPRPLAK